MSPKRIFLSPPHMSNEGYELSNIQDAFASNWIAPLGSYVDRFEKEIAALSNRAGGVALSSGTAAIHLALKAAGMQPQDRVICSSFTFAASCNPIVYEQGIPIFIDSEYKSWNLDPDLVEQALNDYKDGEHPIRAILAVSLYGQPAQMTRLEEIAKHYDVILIDEATEALGASIEGRPCGSFGQFGIFSFNGNKMVTTSGGGMVVADREDILSKMRFWATQSRDPAPYYQHSELGYNYRLSNISAAIGCGQLTVLPQHLAQRKAIFTRYEKAMESIEGISMMPVYGEPCHWLSVALLDKTAKVKAAEVIAALEAENIESRHAWKPMEQQPYWQAYPFYTKNPQQSVGNDLFTRGICLPSGSSLSEEDQHRVIDVLKKLFQT